MEEKVDEGKNNNEENLVEKLVIKKLEILKYDERVSFVSMISLLDNKEKKEKRVEEKENEAVK